MYTLGATDRPVENVDPVVPAPRHGGLSFTGEGAIWLGAAIPIAVGGLILYLLMRK
jgi:hypothetical protein